MSTTYTAEGREVWAHNTETNEYRRIALCDRESDAGKTAEAMNACDGVDVPGAIKLLANKTLPPLLEIIERIGGAGWREVPAVKNARFLLENLTPSKR